jgi:hypothetical protein
VVGDLVYGSASFVAVDKGVVAYVAIGGFEVLDAPGAETQCSATRLTVKSLSHAPLI